MEDKKTDKQTVFVRGVSFDVTDQELNDFFSDIGPVRQAFLVKTKGGQKAHKGFGFVQYALQSDAERAAVELSGKELQGRKLQVEVAIKRAPLEERKKKRKQQLQEEAGEGQAQGAEAAEAGPTQEQQQQQQEQPAKKARPAKPAAPAGAAGKQGGASEEKHRMMRAVAVGRLTPETVNAAIKLAQAAGEVEEVVSPIPQHLLGQYKLERDGCSGQAFLVVYSTVKQAMAAVAKLHGQAVGPAAGGAGAGGKKRGGKKRAQQQQEGDVAAGVRLWVRQVSGEGLHLKRWRLIVRNLPFTAAEADLRTAFSPSGFIWELTLPRSPDGKGRGFAFVGYTCRAHAERGVAAVNGQQLAGRPVAVDWAVSKAQFDAAAKQQQQQQPDGKASKAGKEGPELDSDLEGHSDEEAVPKRGARHKLGHESDSEAEVDVAPEQERGMLHSVIDSILGGGGGGKEREGKGKGKRAASEAAEAAASDEEEEEEEEGWGSGEESDEDGEASGEGEESGEESGEDSEEEGGDMFSKKALHERSAAQRAALERLDRKLQAKPLGKAAAAAEGAKAGAGDAAAAGEGARGDGARGDAGGKAREQAPEGATVFIRGLALDVTKQQLQSKLQAFGRVVSCRLVVDKASGRLKGTAFADFADAESAHKAAEACAKARRKEGPGVVVAGRTVDVDVALGQEAVRSLAVQKAGERGPKDKRNMYLAKEGAIAEGSPAWEDMSQQDKNKRKRAAVEKKTKLASPNFLVSSNRLSVRNIPHSWTEKQLKQLFTQAVIERASKAQPKVRQVKILVEEATGTGAPRSKGIGFVEFEDHQHALCALRQLNNNPKPWGKERRPIVEFAIENAKILKAREAKLARSKQQQQQRQEAPAAGADGSAQQAQAAQQAAGDKEAGRPAKRSRTEQQGAQAEEGAAADGRGNAGAGAGADGEEGGPAQAQQSKRQRKREIRLKLRAAKQQKLQEAAAAAAAAKEKGGGKGAAAAAAEPPADSAHNRAKKRRELRKAKMQGGAAGGVGGAAAQPQLAAAKQQGQQQQQGQKAGQRQAPKGAQQQQQQQQPRQQGQRQGVKGKGAGMNSKAGKGVQQAQREQQAQQRKRRADDALDSLVGGMTGGPKKPKQPRKSEGNDKLDRLAAEYRAKFFDGGSKKSGAKAGGGKQPEKSALKRWFD